jgi:nitrate reductase beta subunit
MAVRVHMRSKTVGNVPADEVAHALADGKTTADEAEAIFRLTSLPTFKERFVLPPMARELAIEARVDPFQLKREGGFGVRKETPERRF